MEGLKKWKDKVMFANVVRERPRLSLGPLSLNIAAGHPSGIPSGAIVQVTGEPSTGKSTLSLDIIKQAQRNGLMALYVDFERSFDTCYAEAIGVDTSKLLLVKPDYAEEGYDITEYVLQETDTKLVVVDSVAMGLPSSEVGKSFGDSSKMASAAGIVTRFCQRNVGIIDNKNVTLLMINQLRANFNTMSPETTVPFGGKALQFATSLRIDLKNVGKKEDYQNIRGIIYKNKFAPPKQSSEFTITYGSGIDHAADIINLAIVHRLVSKNGSWFTYKDVKAQGVGKLAEQIDIDVLKEEVIAEWNRYSEGGTGTAQGGG